MYRHQRQQPTIYKLAFSFRKDKLDDEVDPVSSPSSSHQPSVLTRSLGRQQRQDVSMEEESRLNPERAMPSMYATTTSTTLQQDDVEKSSSADTGLHYLNLLAYSARKKASSSPISSMATSVADPYLTNGTTRATDIQQNQIQQQQQQQQRGEEEEERQTAPRTSSVHTNKPMNFARFTSAPTSITNERYTTREPTVTSSNPSASTEMVSDGNETMITSLKSSVPSRHIPQGNSIEDNTDYRTSMRLRYLDLEERRLEDEVAELNRIIERVWTGETNDDRMDSSSNKHNRGNERELHSNTTATPMPRLPPSPNKRGAMYGHAHSFARHRMYDINSTEEDNFVHDVPPMGARLARTSPVFDHTSQTSFSLSKVSERNTYIRAVLHPGSLSPQPTTPQQQPSGKQSFNTPPIKRIWLHGQNGIRSPHVDALQSQNSGRRRIPDNARLLPRGNDSSMLLNAVMARKVSLVTALNQSSGHGRREVTRHLPHKATFDAYYPERKEYEQSLSHSRLRKNGKYNKKARSPPLNSLGISHQRRGQEEEHRSNKTFKRKGRGRRRERKKGERRTTSFQRKGAKRSIDKQTRKTRRKQPIISQRFQSHSRRKRTRHARGCGEKINPRTACSSSRRKKPKTPTSAGKGDLALDRLKAQLMRGWNDSEQHTVDTDRLEGEQEAGEYLSSGMNSSTSLVVDDVHLRKRSSHVQLENS